MNARLLISVGALSLALALPLQVFADSYRCGRKLVRTGDTRAHLLRVCGEPLARDRGVETVVLGGSRERVRVERWIYRKSPRSLGRAVLLHQGKVVAIRVTGR